MKKVKKKKYMFYINYRRHDDHTGRKKGTKRIRYGEIDSLRRRRRSI